jgi:hypothetical protein
VGALLEGRPQIVEYQIAESPADSRAAADSGQEVGAAQLLGQQRRGSVAAEREGLPLATPPKWCPRRSTPSRGPSEHPCAAQTRRCPYHNLRRTL